MNKKISVVIVAAGSGSRFGDPLPKQYHHIGDKTLLRHSIEAFMQLCPAHHIQVVYNPLHQNHLDAAIGDLITGKGLRPAVAGGATRQQSVLNGLRALSDVTPDYVLVHDAARPGIDPDVIYRVLDALQDHKGAIPGIAVHDTIKQCDDDKVILRTIARDTLMRAQTPQGFDFNALLMAHTKFEGQEMTDDASLLEQLGIPVKCVPGSERNDKITRRDDIARLSEYLTPENPPENPLKEHAMIAEEYRTGTGFDVHRFAPGDACMLCGVSVPHKARLEGHSDADVGLHALTDAILGAIAAGDIGQHFPPSDPQWKGAASDQFLKHAANLVAQRNGRIVNVDVTLICERPKIGPHTPAMRQAIATILSIDIDRVNVKATTSERLGFTGREEGIAAQAVASIALPRTA
ncbi:bifunctional 2-C-methyl-D-erythritol 4-phosphate cytidylyltransferase/2-C-methyl-D-erythritol 2,4-cyclodiphosphate synthase [Thalassospira sp. TSL5-1]|uniref:bifunctional 2-C-methyl-D-erythritol 4-phosphate cytidylyltransferase/2-C-methyl-D-erythritol 2,4-cyclodiphosphate synthase n=1 Tax=Thalassospira sp. TSL5-1 TaxID=1544451 RepID=UPI00093FEA03|nr:bifunctional 2-C-methyl-D-erythritol 4-phosphate cytidylyltransferase/2-C-methyl-D-erythritol 2,4-cyclodiphosphate synthase [Thalassospira sp. TSL5-1]OKH89962.1 2-C-methyl-D-erythritol 4-phosphate cytidylyltransferase [Thalassospira sp. TSL5-1]